MNFIHLINKLNKSGRGSVEYLHRPTAPSFLPALGFLTPIDGRFGPLKYFRIFLGCITEKNDSFESTAFRKRIVFD